MAGRQRARPRTRGGADTLSQFGLLDVTNDMDDLGGSDGDRDLEAELAAISGGSTRPKPKPKAKPKLMPAADLDNLIADSLRDIPSDEDVSDGEMDPDLLNELSELTIQDESSETTAEPAIATRPAPPIPTSANAGNLVSLLEERIKMYITAEQNAKDGGDSTRARRFGRGLKTLKDQLKQAKAGKQIIDDDIPPPVSVNKQEPIVQQEETNVIPPVSPDVNETDNTGEPEMELDEETQNTLQILNERLTQYKHGALSAKSKGDNATAMEYMKIMKQFQAIINAIKKGQSVDLSNMPGPPGACNTPAAPAPAERETEHIQKQADDSDNDGPQIAPALITASSAEEALQQRFELYKQQEAAAAEAGNSSKARRMGRIVKQYQQAIKLHAAGKPIPFDELPTPPGYAPIPGAPVPVPEPAPAPTPAPVPSQPVPSPSSGDDKPGKLANTGRSNSVRKMGNHIGTCHVDKQFNILLKRQKEFKEAALESKKKGEIKEAKEYLRYAKGIDPLLEAARCGLPVDLSTVPIPPQAKQELEDSYDSFSSYDVINADDCGAGDDESGGILTRLEEQLTKQLKLCITTRDHHKCLGDVAGTNRFEHLALAVKQDLDVIKHAKRMDLDTPKFHYETKQFNIVQSCTDLTDNDLELTIVRGINYNVPNPKDVDTFVRYEFPYPQEVPVRDKTSLIKNTNSPEYNAVIVLPINRSQRPCLRVFKRQAIKLEVYSRGGLFSRDSLIGTINIKLQPLETQTVLHESFDLMDGRKTVGGKLEVKIRVRHPLLTKQIEQITEKWLIIDN